MLYHNSSRFPLINLQHLRYAAFIQMLQIIVTNAFVGKPTRHQGWC